MNQELPDVQAGLRKGEEPEFKLPTSAGPWKKQRNSKKHLHDPDNHHGVITYLEPDILECEVKWALESITTNKASGGDSQ